MASVLRKLGCYINCSGHCILVFQRYAKTVVLLRHPSFRHMRPWGGWKRGRWDSSPWPVATSGANMLLSSMALMHLDARRSLEHLARQLDFDPGLACTAAGSELRVAFAALVSRARRFLGGAGSGRFGHATRMKHRAAVFRRLPFQRDLRKRRCAFWQGR